MLRREEVFRIRIINTSVQLSSQLLNIDMNWVPKKEATVYKCLMIAIFLQVNSMAGVFQEIYLFSRTPQESCFCAKKFLI